MKIAKKYKLEKVASSDATRPSIQNILIAKDGEKTLAIATNGRSLAIVPVEVEAEHEYGLISPEALVLGRKVAQKMRLGEESSISPNGNIAFPDGSALPRPTEQDAGTYPNWKQILPGAERKTVFTIALDPVLLLDLAQAIGAIDGVKLQFEDGKTPIIVTNYRGHSGEQGILMPMRIGG